MKIGVLKHRHHRHPSSPGAGVYRNGTPPFGYAMMSRNATPLRQRVRRDGVPFVKKLCPRAHFYTWPCMCVKYASLRSGQGHGPCAAVRLTQFQGGMVIAKTKEQLQRECAELEQRIRQHQNRLQRLEQRTKHIAKGERQKRAHRLITRGAAVESVAPAVCGMTEHEFYELAERIFALPEVQALLPKGGG